MQAKSWPCEKCGLSFQRRGHYERHLRTHAHTDSVEKSFVCTECEQGFSRIDSLARHLKSIHGKIYSRGQGGRLRVIQACIRCNRSKLRCDGGRPCKRCGNSGTTCSYRSSEDHATAHNEDSTKRQRLNSSIHRNQSNPENAEPENSQLARPELPNRRNTQHDLDQENSISRESYYYQTQDAWMPSNQNTVNIDLGLDLNLGVEKWPDLFDLSPSQALFNELWTGSVQSQSASMATSHPILGEYPSLTPTAITDIYEEGFSPATEAEAMEPRQYNPTAIHVDAQLSFPDMERISRDQVEQENFAHVHEVHQEVVDEVTRLAKVMESSPTHPTFARLAIPPVSIINSWVQLYFEHFHPVFPVLHQSTFGSPDTHWLLVFAVSAIGAQFSQLPEAKACSRAMNEIVRRQASYLCENQNQNGRELWMVQVILLNQISLRYSGERRALAVAELLQALPVMMARRKHLFTDVISQGRMDSLDLRLAQRWQVWKLDEERRRTGFATWIIDQAFETHFGLTSLMRIEELQNSLPQGEDRWAASSAQGWASYSHQPGSVTLEQVFLDDTWLTSWMKSSVLGRQTMLQILTAAASKDNSRWAKLSPGPILHRKSAQKILINILAMVEEEDEKEGTHWQCLASGLKANAVHRMTIIHALMLSYLPSISLVSSALRLKYQQNTSEGVDFLSDQWKSAPQNRRRAVDYAARLFGTIKGQSSPHFSTPVMLFHATLVLWLHTILSTQFENSESIQGNASVFLGTSDSNDPALARWIESGWGDIKIPGVGSLFSSSSALCRLLTESVSIMRSLNNWGISRIYGQIINCLRAE